MSRKQKKLKTTLETHDNRLAYVETRLHEEVLSKWAIRGAVGLVIFLTGAFLDLIVPLLIKTTFFSLTTYNLGIGRAQGFLMGIGGLLLIVSACWHDLELRSYKNK